MEVKVYLKTRANNAYAEAIYDGTSFTVLPGGKISEDFAEHIQGGRKAKSLRQDPEYVNENGEIIKPCVFTSPSTASQFVTGRSTNGYKTWKVERKKTLGEFLKERGLR